MLKKIAGGLLVGGGVATAVLLVIILANSNMELQYLTMVLLGLLVCAAAVYYPIATKFWTPSATEVVDRENLLLEKKIEQAKLRKQLADVESEIKTPKPDGG